MLIQNIPACKATSFIFIVEDWMKQFRNWPDGIDVTVSFFESVPMKLLHFLKWSQCNCYTFWKGTNVTVTVFKKVLMKLCRFYFIGTNETVPISKFSIETNETAPPLYFTIRSLPVKSNWLKRCTMKNSIILADQTWPEVNVSWNKGVVRFH